MNKNIKNHLTRIDFRGLVELQFRCIGCTRGIAKQNRFWCFFRFCFAYKKRSSTFAIEMANRKENNVRRSSKRAKLRSVITANRAGDSNQSNKSGGAIWTDDRGISSDAVTGGANPQRVADTGGETAAGETANIGQNGKFAEAEQSVNAGIRGRRRRRNPITGELEWPNNRSNSSGDRTDSNERKSAKTETIPSEPVPIRKRGRRKRIDDIEKAAMLGLIAVGCTSLFEVSAMFLGRHWALQEDETIALAQAIDGALNTLPGEYYAVIRKVVESWFPWLTLSIIASKIIIPRVEETLSSRSNAGESNTTQTSDSIFGNASSDTGFVNGSVYRNKPSFR